MTAEEILHLRSRPCQESSPGAAPSELRRGRAKASPLRILLSEGSSTSAREAITILGMQGHHVEVCDPDPRCLGRFSRFVRRFHRCPGLGVDPAGYVIFVLALLARRRLDVLLPIHEQGYALSKIREAVENHVTVALPSHAAYQAAHSKASFSRLLSELDLPQPRTQLVKTREDVLALERFPLMLKAATGTASRTVWPVKGPRELAAAVKELARGGAFADVIVAQQLIEAPVEHAQAVFDRGRLLGMHAYRQIVRGAGGGDAVKESVNRPLVREHLTHIGKHLDWHGALSVDYMAPGEDDVRYIDCNPRLVEPMNALLAGHDLLNLLLQVTRGSSPEPLPPWPRRRAHAPCSTGPARMRHADAVAAGTLARMPAFANTNGHLPGQRGGADTPAHRLAERHSHPVCSRLATDPAKSGRATGEQGLGSSPAQPGKHPDDRGLERPASVVFSVTGGLTLLEPRTWNKSPCNLASKRRRPAVAASWSQAETDSLDSTLWQHFAAGTTSFGCWICNRRRPDRCQNSSKARSWTRTTCGVR
jgi:hypothetical protein